jgi:hypothetical protein
MLRAIKVTAIVTTLLISTSAYAQLKIIKFGVKGGTNYPQEGLSLNDINDIVNNQTFNIDNIQTVYSDGFNAGLIARVSLPLIPVYVHGEALYTQFKETIQATGGDAFNVESTIERIDFPISAGAKLGPAFAGLGATPSIPLSNASDLWTPTEEANFTWGWHIHAGVKLWRLLGEVKYESGFGFMSGNFNQNIGGNDYTFDLDQRRSQVIVSVAYFFK